MTWFEKFRLKLIKRGRALSFWGLRPSADNGGFVPRPIHWDFRAPDHDSTQAEWGVPDSFSAGARPRTLLGKLTALDPQPSWFKGAPNRRQRKEWMGNRLTERIARGGDKEKGKEKKGRKGRRKRGGRGGAPLLAQIPGSAPAKSLTKTPAVVR